MVDDSDRWWYRMVVELMERLHPDNFGELPDRIRDTCWLSGGRSEIELLESLRQCWWGICGMRLWLTLLNACGSDRLLTRAWS